MAAMTLLSTMWLHPVLWWSCSGATLELLLQVPNHTTAPTLGVIHKAVGMSCCIVLHAVSKHLGTMYHSNDSVLDFAFYHILVYKIAAAW